MFVKRLMSIKNKYKSLPLQVKAAFWFTVCSAVQNGCKFLAMPVLVRLLTTEEYGIYSVFLSWVSIISILATINMQAGVFNNAMFKFPDKRDEYTSAAQSISITATIILFVIYLLFHNFFNGLFGIPENLSVVIFIQLLFTEGFLVWSSRQRYEYRYKTLVVYTSIFSVLNLALPIVAGLAFSSEKRLNVVIYAGSAIQIFFGLGFIIYNYIKGKCFFKKEYWRFALSFNIPLIPHYLSGIILGQSDRVMIQKMISFDVAGIYSFTYNISLVMNIITNSINSAIVPYTYERLKERDFSKLRLIANFLLIGIGGLILLFSAVAPELIKLFATDEYYEAIPLVPIISLSSYFMFMQCLFGNVEFYFEENKFIMIASVTAAVANIVLNMIFIPIFGYYAAGCTTLACYALSCLAHHMFMRVVCRKRDIKEHVYDYKAVLIITVIVLASAFGMLMIYNYWYIRYTLLLIALVVIFLKRRAIIKIFKMIGDKKL